MARKTKAQKIAENITSLQDELIDVQSSCKHENTTKTNGGNSGNYDPLDDSYWVDFKCHNCLKSWRVYND